MTVDERERRAREIDAEADIPNPDDYREGLRAAAKIVREWPAEEPASITSPNPDGSRRYDPPADAIPARLVPALACSAASRVVRMRDGLKALAARNPAAHAIVAAWASPHLGPLPFEAELMSGKIERVHGALVAMAQEPPLPTQKGPPPLGDGPDGSDR